ncbi:hypothetical protein F4778DRAFT_780012 [Xylariomycetidae sp. FL2044]|nr:hypothetical protein F4778DRAFT_780012 [Xylariomycetidae sp. FL2044]
MASPTPATYSLPSPSSRTPIGPCYDDERGWHCHVCNQPNRMEARNCRGCTHRRCCDCRVDSIEQLEDFTAVVVMKPEPSAPAYRLRGEEEDDDGACFDDERGWHCHVCNQPNRMEARNCRGCTHRRCCYCRVDSIERVD